MACWDFPAGEAVDLQTFDAYGYAIDKAGAGSDVEEGGPL